MTCRSWWCAPASDIELGAAPHGTAVTLPCGCSVIPTAEIGDAVAVTFVSAACAEHAHRPADLPRTTPVRIDLLSTLLRDAARVDPYDPTI